MSIKSKAKSIASKAKSAAVSYGKNVAGGAKIVGSFAKDVAKEAGQSLAANPLTALKNQTGRSTLPTGTIKITPDTKPRDIGTGKVLTGQQYGNAVIKGGGSIKDLSIALAKANSSSQFKGFGGGKSGGTGTSATIPAPVVKKGSAPSSTASLDQTALSVGEFGGATSLSSFSSQSSPSGGLSTNASSVPRSSVVNTNTLAANNQKLNFAEPAVIDYSTKIPAVQEQAVKETKDTQTALQDYLDTLGEAPNSAKAYEKAQRESGILQKQQLVSDLTGQLNGIVNKGQANQLSLIGQGRGIPEAIIGGQQAQIGRETAIAALPVQAQLSAAQGNLEMANDNLDTLFKIYSDDAEREYTIRKEQKKMVYDIATAKEKRELEKADKMEERAYKETQDLNDERSVYAKMAFENGDSALGAKIAKLDYKSPTFKADLATLSSKIVDTKRALEIQKLQTALTETGTTINPKVLATTQFKAAQAAQNLKLTLEKTKAAVEKYGNYEKANGTGKGILDTLKVQLRSEISTALEQGVVVPGEAESFDKIAGSLNSSFFGVPNVRNSTTVGAINSLLGSMDSRIALQKSALINTYNVSPEQIDTLLNITDLSDQEFTDMDALID